jgi:hypothetical protein
MSPPRPLAHTQAVFATVAQQPGCAIGLQLDVFACLARLRAQLCMCKSDGSVWLPENGAGVRFFALDCSRHARVGRQENFT